MTEYEKAEQDVAAAKVAERIAEWKAMEAKAAYYRYASESMAATAEVMGSRIRRDNALASEFVEKANAALEAPAQPLDEMTTLGPRDPFLDSIIARGGTWHDGGPNPLPDQFVDIYVPALSTNLLNKPNHLEGQPSNAYVWEGWEVAYCASSATAPLIDAQTTDPVDPRIECASDEPDALAEFMKLPGAVKWGGGECPVPQSAVVEYLLRGADLPPLDPKPAFLLSWDHADILGDIIAYRVVSEPAEQYDDPTAVAIAAYIEAENEAPAPEQDASVEIEPGPSVAEVEYEDRRYSGEVDENGNPCGCGTIQYADGRLYAGEVNAQGQAHGAGVMQYPAGHPDMVEQDAALLPLHPEPSPYAEAIEKGAITQSEADLLEAAKAEQASFFAKGMMADADKHAQDQRGIVDRLTGMFKREKEDA